VPDPVGAGPAPGEAFTGVLLGFAAELRAAGLRVGTGDVLGYLAAMGPLDPADLVDLYWAGKATLVSRHDDDPAYDQVFRRYFLGSGAPAQDQLTVSAESAAEVEAALVLPGTEPGPEQDEEPPVLGLLASDADAIKHRSFAACSPEELAAQRRIMARMRLTPPRRRTRRTRPAVRGPEPDLRATIRESMRTGGEPPGRLFRRQRKTRLRPLVLILDVSGSMADYSRSLLQFAYSARQATGRSAGGRVEVFCFGTRLTRITRELTGGRVDAALQAAARTVLDWDGGTRIGQSLDAFVRDYGRGGRSRGAVVVICSDGLDRGDPEVLALAMERLSRLCYRIVWLNPHRGHDRDFRPSTLGMMVAAPHIDLLLSGHDLTSLEELAAILPALS
jgi:uncharacterized protein with von Willebrand factor type A (vWA) domain